MKKKKKNNLYPIWCEGKWLEEEECDGIFQGFYHCEESLGYENSVYLSEGFRICPNGNIIEQ